MNRDENNYSRYIMSNIWVDGELILKNKIQSKGLYFQSF